MNYPRILYFSNEADGKGVAVVHNNIEERDTIADAFWLGFILIRCESLSRDENISFNETTKQARRVMTDAVKTRIDKTKQFVKSHQTIITCAATAVVTAYVVHDKDIVRLKAIAARQMLKEDERLAMLLDAASFIDSKGLTEEFFDFAPRKQD